MTDITTTVQAGAPQTIGVNLSAFTIKNQSLNTAVWLSSNPNVSPGNGMKLSALASLQWSGGPCYAVLDSATGSATLSLSTSSSQITDPVAVAQAVNSLGVPNVINGSMISGVVNGTPFDVSNYATVAGQINVPAAGYVLIQFMDPTETVVVYQKYFTFGAKYTGWYFTTPVYGPLMAVYYAGAGGGGANINPVLYGTNRVLQPAATSQFSINGSLNQTYAANTVYPIGSPIATNGGLASFNVRCTPPVITAKGTFGYQFWSLNSSVPGSLQSQDLFDTTMMHVDDSGSNSSIYRDSVFIPAGVIQPYFQPAAAITSSAIVVFTGMVP